MQPGFAGPGTLTPTTPFFVVLIPIEDEDEEPLVEPGIVRAVLGW